MATAFFVGERPLRKKCCFFYLFSWWQAPQIFNPTPISASSFFAKISWKSATRSLTPGRCDPNVESKWSASQSSKKFIAKGWSIKETQGIEVVSNQQYQFIIHLGNFGDPPSRSYPKMWASPADIYPKRNFGEDCFNKKIDTGLQAQKMLQRLLLSSASKIAFPFN